MIRTLLAVVVTAMGVVAVGAAAPVAAAPFSNCTEAKAAGYCDIPSDSPYYQSKLDRDGDGLGCEC
jgi:hypothetical protein